MHLSVAAQSIRLEKAQARFAISHELLAETKMKTVLYRCIYANAKGPNTASQIDGEEIMPEILDISRA